MKKVLSVIVFFAAFAALQAQPCFPGAYTSVGIYPDSITNLPDGAVTQYYNATITAVVPTDTMIYGLSATIDSIGVTNVTGLPAGFTWAANTPTAYFHGGDSGCIAIMGTPTAGMEGTYPLDLYLLSYGSISGFPASIPDTLTYYRIVILDQTHAAVIDSRNFAFSASPAYPNPASDVTEILVSNPDATQISVIVSNILGEVVISEQRSINAGETKVSISVASLSRGVYFYSVSNGVQTITRKLSVN